MGVDILYGVGTAPSLVNYKLCINARVVPSCVSLAAGGVKLAVYLAPLLNRTSSKYPVYRHKSNIGQAPRTIRLYGPCLKSIGDEANPSTSSCATPFK